MPLIKVNGLINLMGQRRVVLLPEASKELRLLADLGIW